MTQTVNKPEIFALFTFYLTLLTVLQKNVRNIYKLLNKVHWNLEENLLNSYGFKQEISLNLKRNLVSQALDIHQLFQSFKVKKYMQDSGGLSMKKIYKTFLTIFWTIKLSFQNFINYLPSKRYNNQKQSNVMIPNAHSQFQINNQINSNLPNNYDYQYL